MKKIAIPTNITRTFHKVGFKLRKHSPEILIVAGVIGTVASAVMACRATTKVGEIIDDGKEKIEEIHAAMENVDRHDEGSEHDYRKDLTIAYAQTGLKVVRLYAPSVILGALSLSGIVASNNILRKRNVALAAAYATIDNGFKDYRRRVIEKFGAEVDKQLKYGIETREIEETIVDENGKETNVKTTVDVFDPENISDYAKFFDELNPYWENDPEYNLMFLKAQQRYANDLLKAQGYVFLNDVYKSLGIEPTKAGQVVGWMYDPDVPNGDNYISFGIYDDMANPRRRAFVNGYEHSILLDFNVDGNIWVLM